ncbi:MAG: hypothetical protein NVSMB1_19360 [Polyangiales bacterium]
MVRQRGEQNGKAEQGKGEGEDATTGGKALRGSAKRVDEGDLAEIPRRDFPESREGKSHVTSEGARPPSPEGEKD